MAATNIEEIRKIATPLFEQYKIKQAAVFGSVVRNENTPESDIDLLVDFSSEDDLLDIIGLKQDLEEVFGCHVDLLTFNSLLDEEFDRAIK